MAPPGSISTSPNVPANEHRLPLDVKPLHYDVTIRTDLEKLTFDGAVVIDLEILKETSSIVFHTSNLNIKDVTIHSDALKIKQVSTSQSLDPVTERAVLKISTAFPLGSKAQLEVKFDAELTGDMMGYYRSSWEKDGKKQYYALTQFEPTAARRDFPCWDEPLLKATYSVTLISREDTVNLSNIQGTRIALAFQAANAHPNANLWHARYSTPQRLKRKLRHIQHDQLLEKQREKSSSKPFESRSGHGERARQASPSPILSPKKAATDGTVSTSIPVHPKPVPVTLPKASTPTTLLSPSGHFAKCRNRATIPFPPSVSAPSLAPKDRRRSRSPPAKAKSVPVPVKSSQNSLLISCSDPVLSHILCRNEHRNVMDVFPICDDNDKDFERSSTFLPSGRKSFLMTWQQMLLSDSDAEEQERGPRTAPLFLASSLI